MGGPYNRLILQTETGKEWEGGSDDGEGESGVMDIEGDENNNNSNSHQHTATLDAQWLLYCHETQLAAGKFLI